jgi:DNA-binding CsgD family transcriptional regulator
LYALSLAPLSSHRRRAGQSEGEAVREHIYDIGNLIDSVDSHDFLKASAAMICRLSNSTYSTVFVYAKDQAPLYVFDSFEGRKHKDAIRTFIDKTYIISPFYRKCSRGMRAGLYLAKDLYKSNDREVEDMVRSLELAVEYSDQEELGYRTHNWPKLQSEISMAIPLDDGRIVEIAIYRDSQCASFEEKFPSDLAELYPVLSACFRRFWSRHECRFYDEQVPVCNDFAPILSNREREVIDLILKGHSSEAISLILGISITTVKSHRKMSYHKLKISTQAELMSLYLMSLPHNPDLPATRQ